MKSKFFSRTVLFATGSMVLTLGAAYGQTIIDWTPGTVIPDNNPVGITDNRIIDIDNARAVITGLEVRLNITGGWNGDLYASLVHDAGFTVLLNRIGNTTSNPGGSGSSGMNVTFDDFAQFNIHEFVPNSGFVTGTFQPDGRAADPAVVTNLTNPTTFLTSFNESPVQGNWTLFLNDNAAADVSTLTSWGLTILSENRDFAIWDANGNTSGIAGDGTWSFSSSTWATSDVGTSTGAHDTYAQLIFRGAGGEVTVSGTVNPEAGMVFQSDGYSLSGGTINLAGDSAAANRIEVDLGISSSIGSVLAGENGMTKAGAGELVLTGANTYLGATLVDAGTLFINGDQSQATGPVTVATGATLGGDGTLGGDTTIAGIHAAGNGIGIQSFEGDLTYSTGAVFAWEMNYGGSVRGTNYDAVNIAGTLGNTMEGGEAIFRIVLPGSATFADAFWLESRSWADIFQDGAGNEISDWAYVFNNFSYANADGVLAEPDMDTQGIFVFNATTNSLNWQAIPEPSTALAALLMAAGLLRRKRTGAA